MRRFDELDSTPVLPLSGSSHTYSRQLGIPYNTYLGSYLLTMVCGAGWYFSVSNNLATERWSAPKQFFVAPFDNQSLAQGDEYDWHLALVSPDQRRGRSPIEPVTRSSRAAGFRTRPFTCSGVERSPSSSGLRAVDPAADRRGAAR
ncbi:MAG: hypothetical protein ABI183_24970 [Polyangiaceae bacterium]